MDENKNTGILNFFGEILGKFAQTMLIDEEEYWDRFFRIKQKEESTANFVCLELKKEHPLISWTNMAASSLVCWLGTAPQTLDVKLIVYLGKIADALKYCFLKIEEGWTGCFVDLQEKNWEEKIIKRIRSEFDSLNVSWMMIASYCAIALIRKNHPELFKNN